jgi:hypothetical protein
VCNALQYSPTLTHALVGGNPLRAGPREYGVRVQDGQPRATVEPYTDVRVGEAQLGDDCPGILILSRSRCRPSRIDRLGELDDLSGAADAGAAWSQIWDVKIIPWRIEYLFPRRRCGCTTTTTACAPRRRGRQRDQLRAGPEQRRGRVDRVR